MPRLTKTSLASAKAEMKLKLDLFNMNDVPAHYCIINTLNTYRINLHTPHLRYVSLSVAVSRYFLVSEQERETSLLAFNNYNNSRKPAV